MSIKIYKGTKKQGEPRGGLQEIYTIVTKRKGEFIKDEVLQKQILSKVEERLKRKKIDWNNANYNIAFVDDQNGNIKISVREKGKVLGYFEKEQNGFPIKILTKQEREQSDFSAAEVVYFLNSRLRDIQSHIQQKNVRFPRFPINTLIKSSPLHLLSEAFMEYNGDDYITQANRILTPKKLSDTNYEYTKNGKTILDLFFNEQGKLSRKAVFQYYKNGEINKRREEAFDSSGNIYEKITETYGWNRKFLEQKVETLDENNTLQVTYIRKHNNIVLMERYPHLTYIGISQEDRSFLERISVPKDFSGSNYEFKNGKFVRKRAEGQSSPKEKEIEPPEPSLQNASKVLMECSEEEIKERADIFVKKNILYVESRTNIYDYKKDKKNVLNIYFYNDKTIRSIAIQQYSENEEVIKSKEIFFDEKGNITKKKTHKYHKQSPKPTMSTTEIFKAGKKTESITLYFNETDINTSVHKYYQGGKVVKKKTAIHNHEQKSLEETTEIVDKNGTFVVFQNEKTINVNPVR